MYVREQEIQEQQDPAPVKVLLTIDEVAQALSLGRTYCYDLVMRKQIASIKLGRKRRIPVSALHEFVARQMTLQTLEGPGY